VEGVQGLTLPAESRVAQEQPVSATTAATVFTQAAVAVAVVLVPLGRTLLETSAVQAVQERPTHTQGLPSQERAAVGARVAYPVQVARAGRVEAVKGPTQAPITLPLELQIQVVVAAVQ